MPVRLSSDHGDPLPVSSQRESVIWVPFQHARSEEKMHVCKSLSFIYIYIYSGNLFTNSSISMQFKVSAAIIIYIF